MRVSKPLGLTLAALAAALFIRTMTDASLDGRGDDLVPLVAAGRLVASGQTAHLYAHDALEYNLVGDAVFRAQANAAGFPWEPTPFVYPPLVAWMVAPLSDLPFAAIARAWTAVSLAAFAVVLWIVLRMYLPQWNQPAVWGGVLLAACCFEPLRYGFALGQTTAVIVPLMLGALYAERRGAPWLGGALLAVAVFVKLTPIVLVLPWLWRGSWRAPASTGVALAALWSASLATAGVPLHAAYIERVRGIGPVAILAYNNVSLLPTVSRFLAPGWVSLTWRMYSPDPRAAALTVAVLAVAAATAGFALYSAGRSNRRAQACADGFALLIILLAPNIAWTHYYELLLPVIAIVLATPLGGSRLNAAAAALAFVACCRPLLPPQNVPIPGRDAAALAVPAAASLLLWATLVWSAFSARPATVRLP